MELKLHGTQLTAEDYIAAQRLHGRRTLFGVGIFLFIALGLIGGLFRAVDVSLGAFVGIGWILWLVVTLASHYLYMPWKCRRVFKQQKTLQKVSDKVINDEALSIESSYGSVKIPWCDFYKWKSDGRLILLYQSSRIFNMMPRRWFAQEVDYLAFKNLLSTAVGPEGKARKVS